MSLSFTLAARYLWGRKLRTTLTTLAVVFGVVVLFGMNIILPSMLQSLQANMLAASNQVDLTISHLSNEAFSPAALEKVRGAEGVRVAAGLLSRPVNLPANFYDHDPAAADRITVVTLTGLEPEEASAVRAYPLEQGRFLQAGDQNAALISLSLADTLGLKLGDRLRLPSTQGQAALTIVGLRAARTSPGNEEVLVSLLEAQRLFDQPDQINIIEANVNITDEAERAAIQARVQAALGEDYQIGALSTGTEMFASLRLGQMMMSLFGVLALVMGGFIIFNTFRTIVMERRRDVAMLRAVGASRRAILGLILAEGLLQGAAGTLAGLALGYLMGAGILAAIGPMMQQFLNLKIGGPVISPGVVVVSVLLGVGMTVLAGLFPALSATRVAPLEALRPVTAEVQERSAGRGAIAGAVLIVLAALGLVVGQAGPGAMLFVVGLVLVAPALIHPIARGLSGLLALAFARDGVGGLAEGNLTRQPSRAAVTASVTMIALAIMVSMGSMLTSVRGGFGGIVRQTLGSDYLFIPPSIAVWSANVGAGAELSHRLRAVDGVAAVSSLRFAASVANGQPLSLLGIDPQTFPQVGGLTFDKGQADKVYAELAAGRALIVNGVAAAALQLKVGDEITLTTPDGPRAYRLAGVANDYMNAKVVTGYISHANLQADFHKTEDVFLQANLAPGADRAAVEPELRRVVADYPQFNFVSGLAYYEETMRLFDQVFVGIYVVFLFLALPSLIAMLNTLAIGVIERTREIGTLRAVGASQGQVRRMVMAEALLLAGVGTAFGLLAGLYLGYVIVQAMGAFGFGFLTYAFPLDGVLAAVAIGLLAGVAAALIPARQAARLEIVQALRYE